MCVLRQLVGCDVRQQQDNCWRLAMVSGTIAIHRKPKKQKARNLSTFSRIVLAEGTFILVELFPGKELSFDLQNFGETRKLEI